jgi:hypothetical protein
MKGIDMIVRFRDTIPEQYSKMMAPYFNGMILSGIVSSKQSKGLTEQADYVKSKLPGKATPAVVAEFPVESLQKYVGDYELEEILVKVSLKDNKTLSLIIPEQPDMELFPVSKDKFSIKYMEGYSVVFTNNDKGEVTQFVLSSPDGDIKATKKK